MSNRQADGNVIGWKPVAVLAYVKPGTGDRILFNLKRRTDLDQKLISFDVDRYIWDNNLSKTYNATTGEYFESSENTFDVEINFSSGTPAATVDFALDIPFNQIHGRSTAYIDNLGGLDGLTVSYENKTIVFATQEDYLFYNEPEDGWIRGLTFYDDADGFDGTPANQSGGVVVVVDPEYNNGAIIDVVGNGSDFFKREVTVNGVRIMGAGAVGGQAAVPDAWLEKVAVCLNCLLIQLVQASTKQHKET